MLKKFVPVAMATLLVACSSSNDMSLQTPSQSAARMKVNHTLPDEVVVEWVTRVNNAEQCLYPQLAGMSVEQAHREVYSKLSSNELKALWTVQDEVLKNYIGNQPYYSLMNDTVSRDHLRQQFVRLNHGNVSGMSSTECTLLKQQFKAIVAEKAKEGAPNPAAASKKAGQFSF